MPPFSLSSWATTTQTSITMPSLQEEVDKIVKEFTIGAPELKVLTEYFLQSMEEGLDCKAAEKNKGLPMIPAFVTSIPTGRERGVFLAADLGGTNFRVCSVVLNGNSTFRLEQSKSRIPDDLLTATSDELFTYLAKKIKSFVDTHHSAADAEGHFKLGFTFSYPVDQTALDKGTLIRWTKGFKIHDVVGQDVVAALQRALEAIAAPVRVVALANDTVGTFLSHAYSTGASPNGNQGESVIGAIFGTGTNGCYLEPIEKIHKLDPKVREELLAKGKTHMVINTEWGSFDNELKHLPTTVFDERIDKISANPGYHMFEKRISGMFLGEILRQVLCELHSRGVIFTQYLTKDDLPYKLNTPFALDSENLSHIEIDDSSNLRETELSFNLTLHVPTTEEERQAIQQLVRAISRRSAYLSAVPLAAILIRTKALEGYHKEVEIGVDGSVVEYYPGFRSMMRHALALSPLGPDGERKVHILIAKDGSGVGAALCASTTS